MIPCELLELQPIRACLEIDRGCCLNCCKLRRDCNWKALVKYFIKVNNTNYTVETVDKMELSNLKRNKGKERNKISKLRKDINKKR